jgi:hypothetical protein
VGLPAFAENKPNAIVYTPASLSFFGSASRGKNVAIDFVGDGITDLSIQAYGFGNRTIHEGTWTFKTGQAKWFGSAMSPALAQGARIGPPANFSGPNVMLRSEWTDRPNSKEICVGPFKDAQSMYLGVRFSDGGETHFGWVRLNAHCGGGGRSRTYVTGVVTGYAYNTVPNEPILAGQIYAKPPEENDETATSNPERGTLGALSLGSLSRK